MSKILVTGALGNVGGYVAQHLIKKGQAVVCGDINQEALKQRYLEDADCVFFDFTDPATFPTALKEVDRVFIMRPPHLGKPEDLKPFIEFLKQSGQIRLVTFLSLLGVEKNPIPPHHKIEKFIEAAELPYCHIRPSFFMQNISGVHAFEIKHFDRILVPVKKAVTSFIDAQDIGELIATVLEEPTLHQNSAYSVTGPEAISYPEVAQIMSKELGRNITYADPTPSFAKKYWREVRGLDQEYVTVMGMLYLMTRLGGAKQVTHGFYDVMGKEPRTFRDFVKSNLSFWQK